MILLRSSAEKREIFNALHACHHSVECKTSLGIVNTNSLPLGKGAAMRGIFPIISRICHSCYPNANHTWNPEKQGESIYCMKKIMPGEEIFISYVDPYSSRKERKALILIVIVSFAVRQMRKRLNKVMKEEKK